MTRDGRFRLSAAIVLGLLLAAMLLGWPITARSTPSTRRPGAPPAQWLEQGSKNPHSAAHYGIYAFKSTMLLSLDDRGVDAYTGVAAWLEAPEQNEFKYRPAQDATAVARFGDLTAATVLQLLVPLLIVLLAFPAFAAEREQGTLAMAPAQSVRLRTLALGKVACRAGFVLALAVGLSVAGGCSRAWTSRARRARRVWGCGRPSSRPTGSSGSPWPSR